jgi:hypothetical protein
MLGRRYLCVSALRTVQRSRAFFVGSELLESLRRHVDASYPLQLNKRSRKTSAHANATCLKTTSALDVVGRRVKAVRQSPAVEDGVRGVCRNACVCLRFIFIDHKLAQSIPQIVLVPARGRLSSDVLPSRAGLVRDSSDWFP